MAACNFMLPLTGNPDEVLQKVKSAITSQGGDFEGNQQTGRFGLSVFGSTIAGSYIVSGQDLEIIIDEKPFLISCGTIEGFLKTRLGL